MVPISIEEFADMTVESNKDMNRDDLIQDLNSALQNQKNGAKCMQFVNPIWAACSAITGMNMCFTCTTLEADDSEDYEIV